MRMLRIAALAAVVFSPAAMAQDTRHSIEELPVDGVARVSEREAGDAAHG